MKEKKPQLVAICAPSGAGKTTITRMLAERNPEFKISISATTRPPRPNEKEGVHYYFLTREEFFKRVKKGDFLEYEEVYDNFYGTLKSKVKEALAAGYTVLFDIYLNGALSIKKQFPNSILIFLRPPSIEEVRRRLRERKTDDENEIEKRINRLPSEYAKAVYFDYDIINRDLEKTVEQINLIIRDHQKRGSYVSDPSIQK